MAEKRMFAKAITNSDAFMDMPLSTQALYFHFGMQADDDGVVSNPRRIQRTIGAADDDLKILIAKRFVLAFNSGIIVIKHWRLNNLIRKDRYTPSLYQEELSTLYIKPDGSYTDHPPRLSDGQPSDNQLSFSSVATGKVRLGKDRLGKDRLVRSGSREYMSSFLARESENDAGEENVQNSDDNYLDELFRSATEETQARIANLAAELFARYTNREPTYQDYLNVMALSADVNGREIKIPSDSAELTAYCMEQAVTAGKPGNWAYIRGVWLRLHKRGVYTVQAARELEDERMLSAP